MLATNISRRLLALIALVCLEFTMSRCTQKLPAEKSPLPTQTEAETAEANDPLIERDLREIRQRGKLQVLTSNSSTSYFIYRGQPMGYEYEMLQRFSRHIGVQLEIKLIEDTEEMFHRLNTGDADLIANNLAITQNRRQQAAFSSPYNFTRLVLVQRKPEGYQRMSRHRMKTELLNEPQDLLNKTIHISRHSNHYQRLKNLADEMGGTIDIVQMPGTVSPEKLIKNVSEGEIEYTVVEDNVALINSTYYSNIDIDLQVSFPQRVGWAVRENSPMLLESINSWFRKQQHGAWLAVLYNKYFRSSKKELARYNSSYSSIAGNMISEYDSLIKEHSSDIGWDWRLLAAQIYQESKFDRNARSWAGAFGIMQFMPNTARQYGIDTASSVEEQIRAGTLYIKWLNDYWKERIYNREERIKFVLASYNVGLGHVLDAMNLALELGLDPLQWDGHVAECILLKAQPEYYASDLVKYGYCRGEEPYKYVKNIMAHYEHYRKVINS